MLTLGPSLDESGDGNLDRISRGGFMGVVAERLQIHACNEANAQMMQSRTCRLLMSLKLSWRICQ